MTNAAGTGSADPLSDGSPKRLPAGTLNWSGAAAWLTSPSTAITSVAQNFVRFDTKAAVAGHLLIAAGTAAGTARRAAPSPTLPH